MRAYRPKKPLPKARPDPKGRKVGKHTGLTGVPIPAASLVGLDPKTGEVLPYEKERKPRTGIREGKKHRAAVEARALQLLGKKGKTEEPPVPGAEEATVSSKKKSNASKSEKKMSGLDAAAAVLAKAGKPLSCPEIVERAKDKGLWKPGGKTPAATLSAAIGREIKEKGKESRFAKVGRGQYELKK